MTTTTLPKTLRSFYNLTAPEALEARCTALLLVDFQREFTDGALPVPDAPSAIERASLLLRWARTAGLHAVHVHQESPEGGPLFAAGTRSAKIVDELSPAVGELVIHKRLGGAFSKTPLDAELRARGVHTLVIAGIMTHLAVDTSVRDATVLGYEVLLAADACATRSLPGWDGDLVVRDHELQRASLAALADRFADVRLAAAIAASPIR